MLKPETREKKMSAKEGEQRNSEEWNLLSCSVRLPALFLPSV
jgi:hypothetical protein